MELKHVLPLLSLFILLIHPVSALSVSSVLDQINDYITSPLSIFAPSPQGKITPYDAGYPCCICSDDCPCSRTSCPFFRPFPPVAHWPVNDTNPVEIATAGCGANYSLKACLNFVQQYLHALQPALESASNHSHHHYDISSESEEGPSEGYGTEGKKGKKKKKKVPCCGDGCSGAQCLRYLAVAVKNLQAPINSTLESVETGANTGNKKPVPEEPEEVANSEL